MFENVEAESEYLPMEFHEEQPLTIAHAYSIDDVLRISEVFARSGYFTDVKTPTQAFAKIFAGQELGVGPMTSMSMIHIIDGKATMDATLVGAQIKKSGRYDYRVKRSDDEGCTLEFFERGRTVGESTFTIDEARRAGLAGRSVWRLYPKDMLRSRAMTRGARMFCPDVFNGAMYTPEEIGAVVTVDGSGAMTVLPEVVPTLDESVLFDRNVSSVDVELIRSIYQHLGVDVKSHDPEVHAAVMAEVSQRLGMNQPPERWSRFTLSQLEAYRITVLGVRTAEPTVAVSESLSQSADLSQLAA